MASNETTNKWIHVGAGLALAALVLTSGGACKHHDSNGDHDTVSKKKPDPDGWAADDETRSMHRYAIAQAVNGADMTLYPRDFDGDQVNAFGRDKLDLIVRSLPDSGAQRTLYINPVPGAAADANASGNRRSSVEQYLRDANVAPDAIAIKDGPRPDGTSAPAVENLSRMVKLESPGHGDTSNSSSGSSSSGGASGGSSSQ